MSASRGVSLTLAMLRQRFAALLEENGFESAVFRGLKILEAKDGKCECSMLIEQCHANRSGFLHGGVTASLLDVTTTIAIETLPPFARGVSTDLSVSYLKSAAVGEELLITAQVLKQGQTLSFATGTVELITPQQKRISSSARNYADLIAHGKHTKFIQQKPSKVSTGETESERG